MNTQEVIQIVRATCRRLVKARLNDCHRRLKRYKNKTQQLHDKLKQLILTELLDIVTTIADKRDNKATERARTGHQQKLTGLLRNKEQRRSKPDDNWVRNISSRLLDRNETRLLSYGQKHSVTPKRIPTKYLVLKRLYLGNESYLSLLRVTSEVELLPLYNQRYNMAATRLKTNNMPLNDENIVILPADKGRVTVVMDKTDYHDKMDALVK